MRNKTGKASKGVRCQEGNQTLKAERGGQATPAKSVPSMLHVLEGSKAHERSGSAAADLLGVGG